MKNQPATTKLCLPSQLRQERKIVAHGGSRGLWTQTRQSPSGATESVADNLILGVGFLSPLRGLLSFRTPTHGLRHGLFSAAAPRLGAIRTLNGELNGERARPACRFGRRARTFVHLKSLCSSRADKSVEQVSGGTPETARETRALPIAA